MEKEFFATLLDSALFLLPLAEQIEELTLNGGEQLSFLSRLLITNPLAPTPRQPGDAARRSAIGPFQGVT